MKSAFQWFCLVILFSCQPEQDKIQPSVEDITESVYASGVVKSKNQYEVFSTVNGIVKEIQVIEGQFVKKGTPILKIFNKTSALNALNAQLAADYAQLSKNQEKLNELRMAIDLAKSKMKNDSVLWNRQQNLWKQNIGSRIELEQKELNYKNAVNNYKSSVIRYNDVKRQLELAANQSQNTFRINSTIADEYTIRSEVDGKIYSLLKEPGEMVNIQSPVALIGDDKTFLMELQIDENDIVRIRENQKVLITMDSYKDKVFEGVVIQIEPVMNERTKSFTVKAAFTDPPGILYPFLTVEANIIIQTKKDALTIPRACLVDESFVITEGKERKKVVTGLKDYQKVEILSGLNRNEKILKPEN